MMMMMMMMIIMQCFSLLSPLLTMSVRQTNNVRVYVAITNNVCLSVSLTNFHTFASTSTQATPTYFLARVTQTWRPNE
jgi:hypothetical protein